MQLKLNKNTERNMIDRNDAKSEENLPQHNLTGSLSRTKTVLHTTANYLFLLVQGS